MRVLIDTSVWVSHFRNCNNALSNLLVSDRALSHPLVLAELACGTPPSPRSQTLRDIELLPRANEMTLSEIMDFIEREEVYGLGCGFVDIALLTSTLITPGVLLWTVDKRLAKLTERFCAEYFTSF